MVAVWFYQREHVEQYAEQFAYRDRKRKKTVHKSLPSSRRNEN